MSAWAAAAAKIAAAFRDPEPIFYVKAGGVFGPLPTIRSDASAPEFDGAGRTLRTISYELGYGHLHERPRNGETFTHRGRRWQVTDVSDLDDVAAWRLVVTDVGVVA